MTSTIVDDYGDDDRDDKDDDDEDDNNNGVFIINTLYMVLSLSYRHVHINNIEKY
jgi:hypothetical protein